jgi:hypothetical protein
LFYERHELPGRTFSRARLMPTKKGLESSQFSSSRIDDRLVMQLELVVPAEP